MVCYADIPLSLHSVSQAINICASASDCNIWDVEKTVHLERHDEGFVPGIIKLIPAICCQLSGQAR